MIKQMKDSGIRWVGEIPLNWDVLRGKFLFDNHKDIVGYRVEEYERLALTLKGVIKRSKDDNEGLQPTEFSSYQILKEDELVFKLIDLQNISTSRVGLSPFTGIVSPAYVVLKAKETIDPRFAQYYYLMMWMREIFNQLGDAGVRSNLNPGELLEISLPVPPVSEQQQIADFLDKKCSQIDEISKKIQEEIDTLEEYKKSVITEAVTRGLDPNVEMKDSGVEWIEKIPVNWTTNRIKYLFWNGKGLPITKDNLIDDGVPVISYGQIHSKDNTGVDIKREFIRYVNDSYKKFYPQCRVFKYDFIFADTSEDYDGCGNCVYKRDDSLLFAGYHSIILHSKFKNDNRYYAYLFKTDAWRKQLREVASGVKLFSISQKTIMNSSIIVPSFQEQLQISDYLDEKCNRIDEAVMKKKQQISILEEHKKSLIYEYVTGKKEVLYD